MKNPLAFFLAIIAIMMAIYGLASRPAHANDTVVHMEMVDDSKYPDVVFKLGCSGTDVDDVVARCVAERDRLCPVGGKIIVVAQSPDGVTPIAALFLVACRRVPSST